MALLAFALSLVLVGPACADGPLTAEWLRGELVDQDRIQDADALFFGVEPSNVERATKALSRFLDEDGLDEDGDRALSVIDRALLQRDLWAAFDHTDARGARHLKSLLAAAIKRLALTKDQIDGLPGPTPNDALPAGLLDAEGSFVTVRADGWDSRPLASAHAAASLGRSAFLVRFSLPGGREATLEYLKTLRQFPNPLIMGASGEAMTLNPEIPQLPIGSTVALVRRALLVDADLEPVVSPIVESIELRTFTRIEFAARQGDFEKCQEVALFELDRRGLREAGPSLRQVLPDELVANLFRDRYMAPGSGRIAFVQQCGSCHAAAGILSVNTWKDDSVGCPTDALSIRRFQLPRRFVLDDDGSCDLLAVFNKQRTASFGELRALW